MKFLGEKFEKYTNEYGYVVLSLQNPSASTIELLQEYHSRKDSRTFKDDAGNDWWVLNATITQNIFAGTTELKVFVSDKEPVIVNPYNSETFDDRPGWRAHDRKRQRI